MALDASANFDQLNTEIQDTVYVLELPDLSPVVYLSTDRLDDLPGAIIAMEKRPQLPRQQVDLLEGKTSAGGVTIELVDVGGTITALLTDGLLQVLAVLKQGFPSLPYSQFLTRHTGRISGTSAGPGGNGYRVTLASRTSKLDIKILDPSIYAAEYCSGPGVSASWTSYHPTLDSTVTLTITDTNADSIFDSATVSGPAFHMALCFLFSGGDAAGSDSQYFNAFPSWAGAALSDDEVHLSRWLSALSLWDMAAFTFTTTQAENLRGWLEKELMRVFGGYLTESGSGTVGCAIPTVPNPSALDGTLTPDDIADPPGWFEDGSLLITSVEFRMDWDGSKFGTMLPPIPSQRALSGRYPDLQPHLIESKCLTVLTGGLLVARIVTATLLRRFGVAPRRVTIPAHGRKGLLEAGDHCSIITELYPNADIPKALADPMYRPEVPRYLEITSVQPGADLVLEAIDLTAGTLNDGLHACIIMPNGSPSFASATSTQKANGGFLADAATGLMPDGTAGYAFT